MVEMPKPNQKRDISQALRRIESRLSAIENDIDIIKTGLCAAGPGIAQAMDYEEMTESEQEECSKSEYETTKELFKGWEGNLNVDPAETPCVNKATHARVWGVAPGSFTDDRSPCCKHFYAGRVEKDKNGRERSAIKITNELLGYIGARLKNNKADLLSAPQTPEDLLTEYNVEMNNKVKNYMANEFG
jgi:hypothetical protein